MPIYANNNGGWQEVVPKVIVNGQPRDCTQVWVNAGGTFRPVWRLTSFLAATMRFSIDDSGYGKINFRTGLVELYLNVDRRSKSDVCYVGKNRREWQGNIGGSGWEGYHAYATGSTVEPTLQLKPWELQQISHCTVARVSGRNGPRITQQPSAGNDWTVIWWVNDPQNSSGWYAIDVNLVAK